MHKSGTKTLYDNQADDWYRDKPLLLSDYSARPRIIERSGDVENKDILDLGCGEGYVSRLLLEKGAKSIYGIDISTQMIRVANEIKENLGLKNVNFDCHDVNDFLTNHTEKYDLVIAVFLFNYIDTASMSHVIKNVYDLLNDNGKFIFTVPHPSLPYMKEKGFPFYFDAAEGYISGRDQLFSGEIWRLDRVPVNVQCVHKTFSDYFNVIRDSPFEKIPFIEELHISDEHLEIDPEFFTPLKDLPLHVLFELEK